MNKLRHCHPVDFVLAYPALNYQRIQEVTLLTLTFY